MQRNAPLLTKRTIDAMAVSKRFVILFEVLLGLIGGLQNFQLVIAQDGSEDDQCMVDHCSAETSALEGFDFDAAHGGSCEPEIQSWVTCAVINSCPEIKADQGDGGDIPWPKLAYTYG